MNTLDTLVKAIFQKESLNDCSLEELQTLARQYSYFSPVQLLFTEKLRSENENLYKEQLQKLALYFSNPLWLDYLLNGYKTGIMIEPKTGNKNSIEHQTAVEEKKEELQTSSEEINIESQSVTSRQAEELIHETENENSITEATVEERHENIETPNEEIFIKSETEIFEPIKGEINEQLREKSDVAEAMSNEENQGTIEIPIEEINIESQPGIPEQVDKMIDETNINYTEANTVEANRENGEKQTEDSNTASIPEISPSPEEERSESQASMGGLPDLKEEPAETELKFEPYHTIDYFASQGIKYIPEEKPADRFGQQLKSFTEWLKILKRLPQTEIIKISNNSSEEKIQQLADHSISEGEVVTETMAEVWLKQGNKEKAIEIYNKLCLLNPDKSAYFASLAEQLKNS
jgi:tetratricopeptide (TPR) repeat protein